MNLKISLKLGSVANDKNNYFENSWRKRVGAAKPIDNEPRLGQVRLGYAKKKRKNMKIRGIKSLELQSQLEKNELRGKLGQDRLKLKKTREML